MVFSVRHVAVAITAVLHAVGGIFLSVLALSLQRLFPSLKQRPPCFDYIPDLADPSQKHFPLCRDSSYCILTVTSNGVSSDESLLIPPPVLEADSGLSPNDHAALLLASQARARAARPSLFTLSSSLWTLKESPSPEPSQVGKVHWATTTLSDVQPNTLRGGPTVASFRFSILPQEEQLSEAPSTGFKRKRFLRCKSASSPHLRELAMNQSSSGDHYHRRISVSEQVRKVMTISPGRKYKGDKRKGSEKFPPSESASRAGRSRNRTDPYQAPYFFPSPLSPWANDYSRLDRKLVLSADVPPLSSAQVRPEDHRRRLPSSPGGCMRSMWAPLRRRNGLSHSGNP